MFCPNCGTQNPDTASTCTKCGFNLAGPAQPKFKGTMLMGQQAPGGAPPGVPPGGPPPGGGPP
ncbi:MAG: zinc ribbon domain-containing protein, partial [Polyangiaceae bacterium]